MILKRDYEFEAAVTLGAMSAPRNRKFRVRIEIVGPVARGVVADRADIDAAWSALEKQLAGKHLNEIEGLEIPTCEWVASWIAAAFDTWGKGTTHLYAVEVWEAEHTSARWLGRLA